MKKQSLFASVGHVLYNLKRMLGLAWETDRKITFAYYLTASLSALGAIAISITFKFFVDALIKGNEALTLVLALMAGRYALIFFRNLTGGILNRTYLDFLFRYKLQNKINLDFHQKLSSLDIGQLEDPKIQDLITKAKDTMTWNLPNFLRNLSYFFSYVVAFISSIIVLSPFGLWIPIVIIVVNLPFLYFRGRFGSIQWSLYGSGAPQVRKLWYFTWILSTQTAIREMKIFQSQNVLLGKFKQIQKYLYEINAKPVGDYLKFLTFSDLLTGIVLSIVGYSQLHSVLTGLMSVGSFVLLINMVDSLSSSVGAGVISFGDLYSDSLYVDHYFDVLSLQKTIKEIKNPVVFREIKPPKIEFKNVSFSYADGPSVLKNVSFIINPGENVALVGENGAGKSTIIKLICRFFDVTGGEILINGENIKSLSLENWYKFLSTLFQDFVDYHFSVRENILLGNPEKNDEAEMVKAAKQSGAHSFIEKLPKGYDTILGREFENGHELSIGQWQKLAIARAFYEGAPVLILDEPTSSIDSEAEFEIFNNLEREYKNKTLLLVSHRFSTVRNANKILVLENGQITESGTHKQLLKKNGKYARMFLAQAKGYE